MTIKLALKNQLFLILLIHYVLQPDLAAFHSVYDVVFVDPSGYLNLCSNMRKSTFRLVSKTPIAVFRVILPMFCKTVESFYFLV